MRAASGEVRHAGNQRPYSWIIAAAACRCPRKKSPALCRGRVSLAWRVPARGTAAQIDNIDKAELVPAGFIDFDPLVRDVEIETVRVTRLLPRS